MLTRSSIAANSYMYTMKSCVRALWRERFCKPMQNSIVQHILVAHYSGILRDRRSEARTLDYWCPRPRTRIQKVLSILGSTARLALRPCHQQRLRSPAPPLQSQPAQHRRWCTIDARRCTIDVICVYVYLCGCETVSL